MLSSLPKEIANYCESQLGGLVSFKPASGGCINNGGLIVGQRDRAFIKWNSATKFPDMFEAEARGLEILKSSDAIKIPDVRGVYNGEHWSALLLDLVESAPPHKNFWKNFGEQLAQLHQTKGKHFGLDHNNYMGSLKQQNDPQVSLIDFFIECRLRPQINLADQHAKIDTTGLKLFDKLFHKLEQLLIEEPPSLVHGDLWSGNFMVGPNGEPVLIDPAVAYSHREVDLAMTKLFGGFDTGFYEAYFNTIKTPEGFDTRCDIYNLYPLMIHVNLFGGGYYQQVINILKRYT